MFNPIVEPRNKFQKYLDQLANYSEEIPLKQNRKFLRI